MSRSGVRSIHIPIQRVVRRPSWMHLHVQLIALILLDEKNWSIYLSFYGGFDSNMTDLSSTYEILFNDDWCNLDFYANFCCRVRLERLNWCFSYLTQMKWNRGSKLGFAGGIILWLVFDLYYSWYGVKFRLATLYIAYMPEASCSQHQLSILFPFRHIPCTNHFPLTPFFPSFISFTYSFRHSFMIILQNFTH